MIRRIVWLVCMAHICGVAELRAEGVDGALYIIPRTELDYLADFATACEDYPAHAAYKPSRAFIERLDTSSTLAMTVVVEPHGSPRPIQTWFRTQGPAIGMRMDLAPEDVKFIEHVVVKGRVRFDSLASMRRDLESLRTAEPAARGALIASIESTTRALVEDASLRNYYLAALGEAAIPAFPVLHDSYLGTIVEGYALMAQSKARSTELAGLSQTEWTGDIDLSLVRGGVTAENVNASIMRVIPSASPSLEAVLVPLPTEGKGVRVLVIERGRGGPRVATFDR